MSSQTALGLVTVWIVFAAGCGRPAKNSANGSKSADAIVLFAAASTKDALAQIVSAFSKEPGAVEVKLNADDSSKLATQIVQDAPAHLFLSANEKWADFVKDKGYALESRILLGNTLVLIVPKGNQARIEVPRDLLKESVRRLALAGPTVPAGIYARQALHKLNLLEPLEKAKKVAAGDNVRVTLTYLERGETEAGIVYATDARISDKVEVVHVFDPSLHDPISYPLVLLGHGAKNAAARKFFEFLQSPASTALFTRHGFTLPKGP
ncbi:MAG: molybdate ABC transporter substrate-binding protein [Gemmataceae bacterium]|nr:molybdate ABC transporter substrate-binding protein [Gemmataceae bacterium]MCI0740291.1 molybdate ABC transporter substrate-binding protein [Gemmataceae bacterium]